MSGKRQFKFRVPSGAFGNPFIPAVRGTATLLAKNVPESLSETRHSRVPVAESLTKRIKMAASLSLMLTRSRTHISPLPLVTPGRISIPEPASLLEAIQSALQVVPIQSHPIAASVNGLASQPRMLLALLVYCYATEIYSSRDVRNYIRTDATCLTVLGGVFVFLTEIRAFRKANRSALEQCLTVALRFIEQQNAGEDLFAHSLEDTMIAEEARRRILFAACMDSMELDDACFSC